ncbi:MAG: imidazolonepropionase-like amidohydrolase [Planctomycetota bacterium]|jgi:imidazolonepropionase-like amidohydrolase
MTLHRTTTKALPFLGLLALLTPFAEGGEKTAIKAGLVITMNGEAIENGAIVIEGGRITAVGPASEVQIPWDADVHDHPDMTAFPGFVEAHVSSGMDRPNETVSVAPFLNIRDSIDPVNFYFQDSLRWGVTTMNVQQGNGCVIGAQGMVVKPHGMTVEAMVVRPGSGLKMSASPKSGNSRATQAHALRRSFEDLRLHLEKLVQEKRDGDDRARREALYQGRDLSGEKAKGKVMGGVSWKVDGLELVPRGEIEEKFEPLLDIVEGKLPVWFYCGAPMDVETALDVARENGFLHRTTLVLDDSCWKAADEIAAAGVSVVLDSNLVHVESHPVTGKEKETVVPKVFGKKDIPFAFASSNSSTQSLWYQAAIATGLGLSRADALAAVTTVPAEMLGLQNRVGKLAAGYDGNVLLLSGDPLSITSFVEYVVLEGDVVYDRSKDIRAKHLLEGVAQPNTMAEDENADGTPAAEEKDTAHDDDDEKDESKDEDSK